MGNWFTRTKRMESGTRLSRALRSILPTVALLGILVPIISGGCSNIKEISRAEIENMSALRAVDYTRVSVGETVGHVSRASGPRMLRIGFGLPICYEGFSARTTERTLIPFEIQRNETLRHALDSFVTASESVYEWTWIDDVLFIGPRKSAEATITTSLDAVISLKLKSVSVWDAFVALGVAIQENNPTDVPLHAVQPHCVGKGLNPPPEFLEEGKISLSLSNVTAREAACAIVKASPIDMYFVYVPRITDDYISLYFWENEKHLPLEGMTRSQFLFWNTELDGMMTRLRELSSN